MPYAINETPLGFAFVLVGQQLGLLTTCICSAMTLNMHVSLNFYIVTVLDDLGAYIDTLDRFAVNRDTSKSNEKRIQIYFIDVLKFHYWIIQ